MFWGRKSINTDSNLNCQTKPENNNQKSITMKVNQGNSLLKAVT